MYRLRVSRCGCSILSVQSVIAKLPIGLSFRQFRYSRMISCYSYFVIASQSTTDVVCMLAECNTILDLFTNNVPSKAVYLVITALCATLSTFISCINECSILHDYGWSIARKVAAAIQLSRSSLNNERKTMVTMERHVIGTRLPNRQMILFDNLARKLQTPTVSQTAIQIIEKAAQFMNVEAVLEVQGATYLDWGKSQRLSSVRENASEFAYCTSNMTKPVQQTITEASIPTQSNASSNQAYQPSPPSPYVSFLENSLHHLTGFRPTIDCPSPWPYFNLKINSRTTTTPGKEPTMQSQSLELETLNNVQTLCKIKECGDYLSGKTSVPPSY
jgi:hypothetical protein